MARSSYVYVIQRRQDGLMPPKILGTFTVKKEAHCQAAQNIGIPLSLIDLIRFPDGRLAEEGEIIPWDMDQIRFYAR